MNKSIFITGIDTNIGKTFISIGLCLALEEMGKKVGYFKPFQSGAEEKNGALLAPDIEELKKYSNIEAKFSYLLKGEVSPHLASILSDIKMDFKKIQNDFDIFSQNKDFVVIEGAGGLYCPAIKGNLFSDIIKKLDQEIIIVTTPFLGKINHTLMTIDCAKNQGIKVKGLIINKMPKKPTLSEQNFVKELKMFTDVEVLGIIPQIENLSKNKICDAFIKIAKNLSRATCHVRNGKN